ncbi:MAG: hypothetical protein H0W87_05245 [Actinobacteria bacterium]|nr:hypothetical protein [Actinomycetota bacterium]
MGRLLLCAALVAAASVAVLGGGVASAAKAGNHAVFTDPAGDAQSSSTTNYAADIRQVDVTSTDAGKLTFAVTLFDADAKLVSGDELSVYVDIDRKSSTGDANGFEYQFLATGSTSGTTSFLFCTLIAPRSCQEFVSGNAHDTKTATSTHVVDFAITSNVAAFDFAVIEAYTQPSGTTTLYDFAPDTGRYSFETKSDPDKDGLFGSGDKCPTVPARGKSDPNNNGCPGPFKFIGTKEAHFSGLVFPSFMRLTELRVTGAPTGAKVAFSSPRGGDSATVNGSGTARSKRIKGDFRYGSVITIRITKPQFVGVYLKETIVKSGLRVVRRLCIPATGGAPVKCSDKLKGS